MASSFRRSFARVASDERVRFLGVGATNTIVGYVIYAILAKWVFADLRFGYLLSLVISYAISITLAFVLYRRFVFIVRGNVVVDFIRFVGVYAVSIAANLVALPFLVEVFAMNPLIAQAIVLIVTTIISYLGHKYFSFRRRRDQPSGPTDEPDRPAP